MLDTTLTAITQSVNGLDAAAVPLTTVYTPPAGCEPIFIPLNPDFSKCQPPQYQHAWDHGGYYSPGICPSGYTVGCTYSGTTIELNTNTMRDGETAGICVPSSWVCWEETSSTSGTWLIIDAKFASTDGMSTEVERGSRAPAWEIRWQATDLAVLETPPLQSSSVTGGTETPAETSDAPTTTVTVVSNSGGLSKGAIAGIVVGAIALVLFIVGGVFLWRRRNRTKGGEAERSGSSSGGQAVVEPYVPPGGVHEADGVMTVPPNAGFADALPVKAATNEMGPSDRFAAELPATKGENVGTTERYELDPHPMGRPAELSN